MAGINEEPEIEIEEYEEIVGNRDQVSVREGATDNRAVSIQEPTSDEQFDSMIYTQRPTVARECQRLECTTTAYISLRQQSKFTSTTHRNHFDNFQIRDIVL